LSSVKVDLTKEEKRAIGRPSSPRWELDLVGYNAARNEVLVLECKSYLDSTGVSLSDLASPGARYASRYKLFTEPDLYRVVSQRLVIQLLESGACRETPHLRLGMAVGKIASATDAASLAVFFADRDWVLWGPDHIVSELKRLASDGYDNSAAAMVAKLLLR
jgi:hypothetical protein